MPVKHTDHGPTAAAVAANIRRFRTHRGLTQAELSEALGARGHVVPPLGVRRMEKGERAVNVDDLAALALVLEVSPAALLAPVPGGAWTEDTEQVTGLEVSVSARRVWRWLTNRAPLEPAEPGPGDRTTFLVRSAVCGEQLNEDAARAREED